MIQMKFRKTFKTVICIFVVVTVSISAYVIVIHAISPAMRLGIDSRNIDVIKRDLATVGHITITTVDLENYKNVCQLERIYSEYYNSEQIYVAKADEEMLDDLIVNTVLYLEAEKQDLLISIEHVDQYIDSMKSYFAENEDSDVIKMIREYAGGKGMTLNQYLDAGKQMYMQQLSIGNLRATYVPATTTLPEEVEKWERVKKAFVIQYQSEIHIYR